MERRTLMFHKHALLQVEENRRDARKERFAAEAEAAAEADGVRAP